jgi:Family of unknown function (DUF5335)
MATRDLPRESWKEFFDGFSRRHQGWLVDVEVLGSDIGAQLEAEDLPLEGISADHDNKDISIALLRDGKITEHFVTRPQQVRVEEEGGAEVAIEIESSSGPTTIVTFRAAASPEEVDGLLPEQAHSPK